VLGNWGQGVKSLVLAGEVVVVHRLGWADELRDPREHSRMLVTLKAYSTIFQLNPCTASQAQECPPWLHVIRHAHSAGKKEWRNAVKQTMHVL
jgi:hypothetical protein